MLVIGIDPGTALTGFGLVRRSSDASLELVDYGVIRTSSQQPMPRRLIKLHTELEALLKRYEPNQAAVERLFFQKNVTTAISVGQARGVVLLALANAGLPIEEYTPQDIKIAVTGYGAADKGQMQRMVKMLLTMQVLPTPDDAADALAVAICHAHSAALQDRIEASE
ncbi:MAG: crossover junction endodeoxyribonuclease RuvC [Anaerolineales bacterium]|jgi:crossover junction endodeoxyribonuclease RuvC